MREPQTVPDALQVAPWRAVCFMCLKHRSRYLRWGVLVVAVVVLALAQGRIAFAIDDPTSITIEEIRAYDSVLEDDDLLVVVEYNLVYGSVPTTIISDAYIGRFFRGTTELKSIEPFAFNDNGYGRGIFSFYWTASQKSSDSVEFNDPNSESYAVTFQGNLGQFPGSIPSTTSTTILWQDTADTRDLLFAHIERLARKFEEDAGWNDNADFDDLIGTSAGEVKLTATGEEYFATAIPQLATMIPSIFSTAVSAVDFTETTFDRGYAEDIEGFWNTDGNWMDVRFQRVADDFRVPKRTLTSVVALAMMFMIAAFAALLLSFHVAPAQAKAFGMLSMAVTLPFFGAINWIPLEAVIAVATVCVIGTGFMLFVRRAGA